MNELRSQFDLPEVVEPEAAFTKTEWAARIGVSRDKARRLIDEKMKSGEMVKVSVYRESVGGYADAYQLVEVKDGD
jgi:DNA-binding transcriptional regulator LsrR (DeoR family)